MRDNLYTGVERAFSAAAKHRDVVAKIKKQAQADPELLAMKVVSVVPRSFLGYEPPALKFSALLTEGGAERFELSR